MVIDVAGGKGEVGRCCWREDCDRVSEEAAAPTGAAPAPAALSGAAATIASTTAVAAAPLETEVTPLLGDEGAEKQPASAPLAPAAELNDDNRFFEGVEDVDPPPSDSLTVLLMWSTILLA